MSDVSLLRFVNSCPSSRQGQVIAFVEELGLVEKPVVRLRGLEPEQSCISSRGSFEADRAFEARHNRPIYRPHYKPDLRDFEPFALQLKLF